MKTKLIFIIVLFSSKVTAQESDSSRPKSWNFSVWAEMFIVPNEEDLFNPTFYARHNKLHLEGRYNYEDRNTVSFWVGQDFSLGIK